MALFDYPGSGHLFTDASCSAEYDAHAAELLWSRVLPFCAAGRPVVSLPRHGRHRIDVDEQVPEHVQDQVALGPFDEDAPTPKPQVAPALTPRPWRRPGRGGLRLPDSPTHSA